ncbi:MAG: DUF4037 domain-containing protein [Candidatus Hodarchaeota archaeon]
MIYIKYLLPASIYIREKEFLSMSPSFIKGLELSRRFFEEVIKEILKKHFPTVKYDAALVGPGSEVFGFDDHISTDHHWGPRLQLFLNEADYEKYSHEIHSVLSEELPYTFLGYSTNWSQPDPEDSMTQLLEPISSGPINHRVEIYCLKAYLNKHLDIKSVELSDIEWLMLSEQRLLEFTSGQVFYSTLEDLDKARTALSYFPDNVWYFKIMAEWDHIAEASAFVGRTGMLNDDLGSRIEASKLIRHIIRLTFLLHKKYIPYSKWMTIDFSQFPIANQLKPILIKILKEDDWRSRERLLCDAYLILIEKQNELKITPKMALKPGKYFSRDQTVIPVDKIILELKKLVKPPLDRIKYSIGSIDHFIDDTHMMTDLKFTKKILHLEEE